MPLERIPVTIEFDIDAGKEMKGNKLIPKELLQKGVGLNLQTDENSTILDILTIKKVEFNIATGHTTVACEFPFMGSVPLENVIAHYQNLGFTYYDHR